MRDDVHLRVAHVRINGNGAPFESGADAPACDDQQVVWDGLTDNLSRVTCPDCRRTREFEERSKYE